MPQRATEKHLRHATPLGLCGKQFIGSQGAGHGLFCANLSG